MATSLLLVVLVGCARRWRRAWPAVAGGVLGRARAASGRSSTRSLVEPLFNDFHALPDGELRTAVLALADREGVPVDDVLVADASRRTTTLNAYVSGFGGTRRVVLYDNLVDDVPQDQTLSVVAHELAHARHDDVLTGSLLGAAGAVVGVGLLALLVGRRRGRTRVRRSGGGAAGAGAGRGRHAAGRAGPERHQPPDRDPRRRRRPARSRPTRTRSRPCSASSRSARWPTRRRRRWSQLWFGSHPTGLARIAIARQLAQE